MTGRTVFAAFIIPVFLLLGLCYSRYTPLWSAPDEELHYAYCEYIARNHTIPQQTAGTDKARISQTFHPPLYYLIGSVFCPEQGMPIQELLTVNDGPGYNIINLPEGDVLHERSAFRLRLLSLFFSLITLCAVYTIVLMLFPGETVLALSAVLFTAANPQFLHVSASISNETLATTLATVYFAALLHYCTHPVTITRACIMGITLGACLLAKTSTVFLVPLTACVMLYFRYGQWKKMVLEGAAVFGPAMLTAGWWYQENWQMLTGMQTSQPWFIRHTPSSLEYLKTAVSFTITSFFGYFGALQIPIERVHLVWYCTITLLGTLGLCRLVMTRPLTRCQFQMLAVLFLGFLGGAGVFISLNLKYAAFLGKYFFIVLAPITVLVFTGLRALLPETWRRTVFALLSLLLIAVSLDVFFRIVKPAYARPRVQEGISQPQFCCLSASINGTAAIAQTFRATKDNLCAVRVMLSGGEKPGSGTALFTLQELKPQHKLLYRIPFPVADLDFASRYYAVFPPISDSKNREYLFSISAVSGSHSRGFAAWIEAGDVYPGGTMLENDRARSGDLYFSAYYFTGSTPYSPWEGIRPMVIPQGLYITVRELQFYYECSPDVRAKTATHEKALRIEKALKNMEATSSQRPG